MKTEIEERTNESVTTNAGSGIGGAEALTEGGEINGSALTRDPYLDYQLAWKRVAEHEMKHGTYTIEQYNTEIAIAYYSPNGEPAFQKTACLHIDILGYSDRVCQAAKLPSTALEELKLYLKLKNRIVEFAVGECILRSSSDSFFIGNPIMPHSNTEYFIEVKKALLCTIVEGAMLQAIALSHGFLIRGALTIGDIFADRESVYGTPLVSLNRVESQEAKMPIVMLDTSDPVVLEAITLGLLDNYDQVAAFIEDGVEGQRKLFINYLEQIIDQSRGLEELKFLGEKVEELVLAHRNAVPTSQPLHDAVAKKIEWAAHYHNAFCEHHGVPQLIIHCVGTSPYQFQWQGPWVGPWFTPYK